jgi:hypothetical protein
MTAIGMELRPCIPLRKLLSRPEYRVLREGSAVELRRPDGTRMVTQVVRYGAPGARESDTTIFEYGLPESDEWDIAFVLSPSLRPEDLPAGTEVWSID